MADKPDYRKILTQLYQRYNPEKVKDVDFLLKKFEGREEEMIDKIQRKYEDAEPLEPETLPEPPQPKRSPKKILIWILSLLLLATSAYAVWFFFFQTAPPPAPKKYLYVIADTVYSHTKCDRGEDSRILPFPFGQAIEITGQAEKCITTEVQGKLQYVPKQFLGNRQEYIEIRSIYGNNEAKSLFDNSYEKRALRNYFNRSQIMGDITEKEQTELYGQPRQREVWQVYGAPIDEEAIDPLNTVAKEKFSWSPSEIESPGLRPDDFAVIIAQKNNRERRKLLLFSFNEQKEDQFLAEMDLSNYPGCQMRPVLFREEVYLFGTPYLKLDPSSESEEEEAENQLGLLLRQAGNEDVQYLIQVVQGELHLFSLEKGLFSMYKKDRIYQP